MNMTRESLRYYEELGLIRPERSESKYRAFSYRDMLQLMSIDFYKKRGFSALEIKAFFQSKDKKEQLNNLEQKEGKLRKEIAEKQGMLDKLSQTRQFYQQVETNTGELEEKNFPLYEVLFSYDNITDFDLYRYFSDYIMDNQDYLSSLIRILTMDEHGYRGSRMCIVRPAEQIRKEKQYLEHGLCLYTVIEDEDSVGDIDNPEVIEAKYTSVKNMFLRCTAWVNQHHYTMKGVVYISVPLTGIKEGKQFVLNEVWIPLK